MNDSQNIPEVGPQIPRNAVSIYGQGDAMDDFPVLKAFQQYVDAEHAKAQKRMTTLCIFFVVLMVAVIGVFMMLLMSISQRNNSLSDQLFQVMLKDRDRQNVIVQSPGQQGDSAALLTLQKQLFDQQMKMMEETLKARTAPGFDAGGGEPVRQSERSEFASQRRAHEKQVKTDTDKLKKAQAQLKAERERLAKEKERLHQKEIELQRRKLYPEYYAAQGAGASESARPAASAAASAAASPAAAPAAATPDVDDTDDMKALDAAIAAEERDVASTAKSRDDGSIRYFSDDDEDLDAFVNALEAPSSARKPTGPATGWSMPEE